MFKDERIKKAAEKLGLDVEVNSENPGFHFENEDGEIIHAKSFGSILKETKTELGFISSINDELEYISYIEVIEMFDSSKMNEYERELDVLLKRGLNCFSESKEGRLKVTRENAILKEFLFKLKKEDEAAAKEILMSLKTMSREFIVKLLSEYKK